MRLVVVTGTGTDVGKTYVSCQLVSLLRQRGLSVAARKPLQSYARGDMSTDASLLAAASGVAPAAVCPPEYCYEVAMAPPMAAAHLGRPIPSVSELADGLTISWPAGVDVGLVEGAGGLLSPLGSDGSTLDLIEALGPDAVLIVADAGLGTINTVRLTVRALGETPVVVHLNRFDPGDELHGRNKDWLGGDGYRVTTKIAEVAQLILGDSFALGLPED